MQIFANPNRFQERSNGALQLLYSINSDARLQERSGFNKYVVGREKLVLLSDQSLPYPPCKCMADIVSV